MSNSVTLVRKISAKDLLGNVAKAIRENFAVGDKKLVFGVAGVCSAIEEGTSQYGDWVRFIGDFMATNYLTGEQFRSEKTHVPTVLESVLVRDLAPLKDSVKELEHSTITKLTGEIEFAFTVEIIRHEDDDKGGISYEYVTTPQTKIQENDKISHLTNLLPPAPANAIEVKPTEKKKPATK